MRASRLLSILLLLEARGQVTAAELSDALEVSIRTIYRDIEQLAAAGVPVYADRGRAGGYRLLDGWQSRLSGLTLDEAQSVFLAGLAGLGAVAQDLGLGEVAERARQKVSWSLGSLGDVELVSSRFHLDPVAWYDLVDRPPHLPTITSALWSDRRLHVRYSSWQRVTDRVLDPLGLVVKGGRWYLVARSDDDVPIRMYRCAEIDAAELGEPFVRPDPFDLVGWWSERSAEFESSRRDRTATVRVTARGMRLLAEHRMFSADPGHAFPAGESCVVDVPIESDDLAVRELARLGSDVEVIAPPTLRASMRRLAAELTALYAEEPVSRPGRRAR